MKLSKGALASMEAIAFQADALLFKELTTIIDAFRDEGKFTNEAFGKCGIKEVIFKRTGILIKPLISPATYINAWVYPPDLNRNNILLTEWRREWYTGKDAVKNINEAKGAIHGTVNLGNSTVSGVFSKIECKTYLTIGILRSSFFTSAEIAAILLHELGHVFTAFEFLADTVTTNQALNAIAKAVLSTVDHADRVTILARTEKELNVVLKDKDALADARDARTIQTVLISSKIEKTRAALGSGVYDAVSWEFLADQFSTRHGAGRELVTGLDKMYRSYGSPSTLSPMIRHAQSLITLMIFLGLTVAAPPIGIALSLLVFAAGSVIIEPTYDEDEMRIRRIRNQMVEAVKDNQLDKYQRDKLIEDIRAVDTVLASLKDQRGWLTVFWDVVRPARRKLVNQMNLQHDLERLAANSLFVHSADLKALGDSV